MNDNPSCINFYFNLPTSLILIVNRYILDRNGKERSYRILNPERNP